MKTFDLKLDFIHIFFCIIEFKIKIYINIYYGNINNCPKRFACHLINYIQNKRPKGPHIVHLSTICHLFEELAKANIFID